MLKDYFTFFLQLYQAQNGRFGVAQDILFLNFTMINFVGSCSAILILKNLYLYHYYLKNVRKIFPTKVLFKQFGIDPSSNIKLSFIAQTNRKLNASFGMKKFYIYISILRKTTMTFLLAGPSHIDLAQLGITRRGSGRLIMAR